VRKVSDKVILNLSKVKIMRDSILYSAIRALFVAFCVVIGLCLGFIFISVLLGSLIGTTTESRLTTVNTEEILPNAKGQRESLSNDAPVILQIDINGVIGMNDLDAPSIRQLLVESREGNLKDDRVKGVLLHINTPGGTANDADGIFRALLDYKKKYQVPIYAYVDGLCASGGIYVALAADKIYATNTSLIGSVGVIAPTFINVTKMLDKIGVEALTISAGKDKDSLNPLRPWQPGEGENYRQIIQFYYDEFVNLVTTYRPEISREMLIQDLGARVFPAPEARQFGFIDMTGASLADTLKHLLEKAGITTDHYQVVRLQSKGWWKSLFSNQFRLLKTGRIEHCLSFSPEIDLMLRNQYLYLYCP
jgi:protease IV